MPFISPYIFKSLVLMILMFTLVQSFKPSSNNNISNTFNINSHIIKKPTPKFHMNYSSMKQYYLKGYTILNYHTSFSVLPPFSKLTLPKCIKYLTCTYPGFRGEPEKNYIHNESKIIIMTINHMVQTNEIYLTQPY